MMMHVGLVKTSVIALVVSNAGLTACSNVLELRALVISPYVANQDFGLNAKADVKLVCFVTLVLKTELYAVTIDTRFLRLHLTSFTTCAFVMNHPNNVFEISEKSFCPMRIL